MIIQLRAFNVSVADSRLIHIEIGGISAVVERGGEVYGMDGALFLATRTSYRWYIDVAYGRQIVKAIKGLVARGN
jgi:hypothetical protein